MCEQSPQAVVLYAMGSFDFDGYMRMCGTLAVRARVTGSSFSSDPSSSRYSLATFYVESGTDVEQLKSVLLRTLGVQTVKEESTYVKRMSA